MKKIKIDIYSRNHQKESGVTISSLRSMPPKKNTEEAPEAYDPNSYVLPALYGIDAKKKERVWKIWAIDDKVYKSFGERGGAQIPSVRTFKGVNIGKSNATTSKEQARKEAQRDWVAQLDKGYLPDPLDKKGTALANRLLKAKAQQGNVNVNIANLIDAPPAPGGRADAKAKTTTKGKKEKPFNFKIAGYVPPIKPMHCQVWSEEPKVLKYFSLDLAGDDEEVEGAYIQPKLDGIRMLCFLVDQQIALITRNGNQVVFLEHLRDELLIFLEGYEDTIPDGEGYAETIKGKAIYKPGKGKTKGKYTYEKGNIKLVDEQRFDVISGAVRPVRGDPHPLESQICYHIFDLADPTGELTQTQRLAKLKKMFARPGIKEKCPHIRLVPTKLVKTIDEINSYHDEVAAQGYEGVVIRAKDLKYQSHKKALDMRKHKYFVDEEFIITGVERDEGVGKENFTWVCTRVDNEDVVVTAKPTGEVEQRWIWYDNIDEYVGKLLTIRYQGPLTVGGNLRFPRGVHVRDEDDEVVGGEEDEESEEE